MKKFKNKAILAVMGAMIVSTSLLNQAQAQMSDHEADCAIWLCLPAGFPSGCGQSLSKFKDRIKHFKPPLPSFSSCAVSPDSTLNLDFSAPEAPYQVFRGYVVYINNGNGVTRTEGRSPIAGKCPYNGEITTTKTYSSRGRIIKEEWLSAICTRTQEFSTTLNDYTYVYSESGKPLEVTKGTFKPKLLKRSSTSDR